MYVSSDRLEYEISLDPTFSNRVYANTSMLSCNSRARASFSNVISSSRPWNSPLDLNMSFFGAKQSQSVNPQAVAQAEGELEMIMDLFQKLGNACHAKCINKSYHEADLSKGESVCIDRCVGKYFATNAKIGEKLVRT